MKTRDLATLKKHTDLVTVVQSRGVALSRKGNDYVGLCPFHQEKTASFHVTPAKNLFHCFGCDAAGSVIDFVMRKDGLTFREAVDKLLTESGVVQRGSQTGRPEAPQPPPVLPERAQVLLERVVAVYEKTFGDVPEAGPTWSSAASPTRACGHNIASAIATGGCPNSCPMRAPSATS